MYQTADTGHYVPMIYLRLLLNVHGGGSDMVETDIFVFLYSLHDSHSCHMGLMFPSW